jgi:peptide/nickel transport system ATP-binding protein
MTGPRLLIADEPTTALDVTVQAQILDLLRELQRDLDLAILFITHDLALVRRFAARVGVMYAGRIVESGPTAAVVEAPSHPYTRRLLACAPSLAAPRGHRLGFLFGLPPRLLGTPVGCQFRARCDVAGDVCAADPPLRESAGGVAYECIHPPSEIAVRAPDMRSPPPTGAEARAGAPDAEAASAAPLLRAHGITVTYRLRGGFLTRATTLTAVRDASLEIPPGRVLGLVGESGSGKSTLARVVLGLETPQTGDVTIGGKALGTLDRRARARAVQPVFQDPYTSLNPRRTIGEIVRAPLDILGLHARGERAEVAAAMLERCGLPRHMLGAYPVQLSGGQRQRVAIARALVTGPRLVVCDEPTSALDVSIQSQILNLLQDLQASLGLTYLFISHNLAVVRHLAHRVAVMHRGVLVETGDAEQIFADPQHAYTRQLIAAAPG